MKSIRWNLEAMETAIRSLERAQSDTRAAYQKALKQREELLEIDGMRSSAFLRNAEYALERQLSRLRKKLDDMQSLHEGLLRARGIMEDAEAGVKSSMNRDWSRPYANPALSTGASPLNPAILGIFKEFQTAAGSEANAIVYDNVMIWRESSEKVKRDFGIEYIAVKAGIWEMAAGSELVTPEWLSGGRSGE